LQISSVGDVVVLLDENGKEFRSVEFASWMEKKMANVNKRLIFIIGGPYGFHRKYIKLPMKRFLCQK
jgi:23S rRNA (pseudouridine1915-N3)-methyltransferase